MIIETLTGEESAAVEKALNSYRSMLPRFGSDPRHMGGFESALLGYRGFAERLAADAVYKLDYVLHPRLDALAEGDELHLEGVTFSHVKRGKGLCVTAVDGDGVQRFRIKWEPQYRPGREDPSMLDVTLQSCPPEDPDYEYAEGIGYSHLARDDDRVESRTNGTLWSHNFFEFIDAMDLLRPALAADIAAMPRPKPMSDNVPFSFSEIDRAMVLDVVRLDGGLPGRLARHVVSTMIRERGSDILVSLADRSEEIARWLECQGCVWGGAAMTTSDRDNVLYAVRAGDGRLGLFLNARNTSGPHTAFLAWKDPVNGTASIAAARGGRHIFSTVEAFIAGEEISAPMATIDLATGEHDIGPEIVATAILDLALHHVRFIEEDRKAVADGEEDDRFERVEDFQFFIDANADFLWDEDQEPSLSGNLPAEQMP
jgi:hypothetical protein